MTSGSQDNIEKDDNESKEEHIKQRLKEMGVSEDSERPKESFVSKYGKYFVAVIFVALLAAYWFESNKQSGMDDEQVADTATNSTMQQQPMAYGYGQPMQPPAWVQERRAQMQQQPEPPEWVKQRQAQRPQRPEPPAWVQQRRAWMQQQMDKRNAPVNNEGDNTNNDGKQNGTDTYYPPRYPSPPYPYWQNQPGYYPGNGYGQWPAYAPPYPYGNGYPYYNGWQR